MRLREPLPWRDLTIETSWSPDVIAIEVGNYMEPPRLLLSDAEAPFVGGAVRRDTYVFRAVSPSNKSPLDNGMFHMNTLAPVVVMVVEPTHHR